MAPATGWARVRAKWRSSVRSRATIGASLILAVALVVGALAASNLLRRTLASDAESQLVDRVDEVQLLIDNRQLTRVLAPTGREVGQVQILDANDDVVAVTPGLGGNARLDVIDSPAVGEQTTATVDGATIGGIPGQQYRMVARTVDSAVGPLTIYAVTSLDSADRAERDLRNSLIIGVPLLVALAAFLIYRVVARALAPVDAMRAEVDRIEAADLSGRVEAGSSDDEIANLGSDAEQDVGSAGDRSRGASSCSRQPRRTSCAARCRRSEPSWKSGWRTPIERSGRRSPRTR